MMTMTTHNNQSKYREAQHVLSLADFDSGAPWPPRGQHARLERYEKNRQLFYSEHEAVLGEPNVALRPELQMAHHFVLNLYKRLSTHWADMVWGEPPSFTADEADLDPILTNNDMQEVGYRLALDLSVYGDAVYKVILRDGVVQIQAQPPQYWFPILSQNDINQAQHHVIAWDYKVDSRQNGQMVTERFVNIEIHSKGVVTYRLHRLTSGAIGDVIEERTELTGVDGFLVVPVHGMRTTDQYHGVDDYKDLDSMVLELEGRLAQMSKILDKHAEPGMHGPASALEYNSFTGGWEFKRTGYLVRDSNEDPVPGYLTWDGNLAASIEEFNLVFEHALFVSETSLAAFGMMRQGLAESGSALRRLMMNDIRKANRNRAAFDRALKWVFYASTQLQLGAGVDVQIEWRDGLPEDLNEISLVAERAVKEGFMSRETAIRQLHTDWDDKSVEAELDRIAEDEGAAAALAPAGAPNPAITFAGDPPEPLEDDDDGEQ